MFEFIERFAERFAERVMHRSSADAEVMLKRLHQIEEENQVKELRHFNAVEGDSDKDNFLRKEHLEDGQFRQSAGAAHVALRYWRHGTSSSGRYNRLEDFDEIIHPSNPFRQRLGNDPTATGPLTTHPAFGWESTCFGSFLKESELTQGERGH